jgi:transposase-like protein
MSRVRRLSTELRAEIQASRESVRALAQRLGVDPKSVQRWRRRESTMARAPGRRPTGSSVLSSEEQSIVVAFRQTTLLALDDCLYALKPTLPHLRRSTLHRCLQRHGLSRLKASAFLPGFRTTRGVAAGLGQAVVVVSPARTEEGMFYLFGATDRLTRFAYARLFDSDRAQDATAFLSALVAALPYRLEAILTDDSPTFAWRPHEAGGHGPGRRHPFAAACEAANIVHIVTPRKRPDGQPNPLHRFKYKSGPELEGRLNDFLCAVNYSRRLKTLGGVTPFEMICRLWRDQPELFRRAPQDARLKDA